jgi:hypothetical protein
MLEFDKRCAALETCSMWRVAATSELQAKSGVRH